jgi:iron complex outermembrane receptor protein
MGRDKGSVGMAHGHASLKTRGAWAVAPLALFALQSSTVAQTQLPGIVVTTPSPIVRAPAARPVPTPTAPAAQPSAPQQQPAAPVQQAAAAPPPAAPPPVDLAPPAGIVVVDDTFVATTVVTAPEIVATANAATLADVVQNRPGVAASTFAPGASRPVIRGLDNFRVRVQENGIGSHDVSAISEDHAVPIDPNSATQIEVVRGPATLRYGSQAIGGVVAATNNRVPSIIPPNGIAFSSSGGFESVSNGRDGAVSLDAGGGIFALHVDGFRREAGDYDTPQGRQRNTGLEAEGYSLGGSLVFRNGFIGLAYQSYQSLYHIPGEEAAKDKLRIDLTQEKWTSRGEWRVKAGGIDAIRYWLGFTDYKHDELHTEAGVTEIGSTFKNRQSEGRVEVQHLPVVTGLGVLTGAAGAQWGERKLSAAGEGGELLAPNRTDTVAGFVFEELQATKELRLQAAARIEQTEVKGTAAIFPPGFLPPPDEPEERRRSRTFTPKSGSLGALYELPLGIVARVTGQYVERAPDAAELFSKGPHEATATFEIGNPNMRIEEATTAEIGLKKATGRFRFDTSLYATRFKDFIYKRLTGIKCDDEFDSCGTGDELDQIVFSQKDARFHGLEAAGELDIAPIWRGVWGIGARYDFVDARFADGTFVPRIPPHRVGGSVYYKDQNWLAKVGVLHALAQDRLGENETRTSGYTLLGAELSYTFRREDADRLSPQFTVGIKGDNLLDDDVRNHVSFKKNEVLQPGRTIRVFGRITLN